MTFRLYAVQLDITHFGDVIIEIKFQLGPDSWHKTKQPF